MDAIPQLNIQEAHYAYNQGRETLEMKIDGHVATISPEQRFLTEGYVYLSTPELDFSWEQFLSKITVPPCELTDNRAMEIVGHTNNPVVVQMTKDFLETVSSNDFHAQKNVPIPKAGDQAGR
ncbi:MAG TPA: hypothetical protein DIU37_06195 [Opitutae bacterium]|nr:hypothetical protein [Opitutae bacterium]